MRLKLVKLRKNDIDMEALKKIHLESSISKYITVSDFYFEYIVSTDYVTYYKIFIDDILVGGIHTEIQNGVMSLSICIKPDFQNRGIASSALSKLFSNILNSVKEIKVSIDKNNIPSIRLFEKLGFVCISKDNELLNYSKNLS